MPKTYAKISDRHPFEVYLLMWAVVSITPPALGITPMSPVLVTTTGELVARVWSISMVVGSAIALIGLAWHRPAKGLLSVTGLVLEQIGMVALSGATIFYAGAAFMKTGIGAMSIVGLVLGWGTAAAVQAWKIQRVLNALEKQGTK